MNVRRPREEIREEKQYEIIALINTVIVTTITIITITIVTIIIIMGVNSVC